MVAGIPACKYEAVNPGVEFPCLHCFLFFQNEDPTMPDHCRVQGWCMEHLQLLWYDLDKELSRTASKMAIPQLLDEINILRDPLQAKQRFRHMAENIDLSWARIRTVNEDGDDVELEPLGQYFERLRVLNAQERSGSGS